MDVAAVSNKVLFDIRHTGDLVVFDGSLVLQFTLGFAVSLGDASMPLVLSIRNFDTLALYTYKLAGAYRFSQACACGGSVAAISMIIFLAGKK